MRALSYSVCSEFDDHWKMCNLLTNNHYRPDMSGEATHWFLDLGRFGLRCQTRNPETGQALAGSGSWSSAGGLCWAAVCPALLTSFVLPWRGKTVVLYTFLLSNIAFTFTNNCSNYNWKHEKFKAMNKMKTWLYPPEQPLNIKGFAQGGSAACSPPRFIIPRLNPPITAASLTFTSFQPHFI